MKTFCRDRRFTVRHRVSVPVIHKLWKSNLPEKHGQSLDISEGGMYFTTDAVLQEGETIEVKFVMPEAVAGEPPSDWLCTGQVVRVDRVGGANGKLRVGVRFDCYEVARPQDTAVVHCDLPSSRLGLESKTHDRKSLHRQSP